jgi:hypothetical protein
VKIMIARFHLLFLVAVPIYAGTTRIAAADAPRFAAEHPVDPVRRP